MQCGFFEKGLLIMSIMLAQSHCVFMVSTIAAPRREGLSLPCPTSGKEHPFQYHELDILSMFRRNIKDY
jgi:hypothetical protein